MRTVIFVLCGCVIAMLPFSGMAQLGTPANTLPFAGPPAPEELQVLAPLVGKWTLKAELRPSLQVKEALATTGEMKGEWLHNRHFIRLESSTASDTFREEGSVLYTYDAKRKIYRRWFFSSGGLATESEGQWEESKRTITWKQLNLGPNVTGTVTDVIAKDRIETSVLFQRDDGQILRDVRITATPK